MYNRDKINKIFKLGWPISVQGMIGAALALVDQIMVSSLGVSSIAAVGIGSRFPNIYMVTITAIGWSLSIMISQYHGAENDDKKQKSASLSTILVFFGALIFFIPSFFFPRLICSIYSTDLNVINLSSQYLKPVALSFFFSAITIRYSTLLRATDDSRTPLVASMCSLVLNTVLNYVAIFYLNLEISGVAYATLISRIVESIILIIMYNRKINHLHFYNSIKDPQLIKMAVKIVSPLIINEFLWAIGDTLYSVVYARMGTYEMAAMAMTFPLQGLCISLFSGLSSAGGIMVGHSLGKKDYEESKDLAMLFVKITFLCGILVGVILYIFKASYISLFKDANEVSSLAISLVSVYALVLSWKVTNMTAGNLISSGGKTKYTFFLDMSFTYLMGVPLAFVSAFVFHLSLPMVYLILSIEELGRMIVGVLLLKSGKWQASMD